MHALAKSQGLLPLSPSLSLGQGPLLGLSTSSVVCKEPNSVLAKEYKRVHASKGSAKAKVQARGKV